MGIAPSKRIIYSQRWSVGLLVAAGALNYIDRATLSVANKLIQEDLGIPIAKMGLLLSAFLWAYALSQLPAGWLIDRFGPRRLLGWSLFLWSVAQAAGGIVTGFNQFVGARALLGIGESPLFPAGARVVRDWFGVRERGFAIGLCQASSSIGSFIAIPLLTFLMLTMSWRWMFFIVGAIGVVLAFVWSKVHRDPSDVHLTADEVQYLKEEDENATKLRPSLADWKQLFAHRTTWGMVAGFFGTIYTLWLYTSWLPFYLERERHLSIAQVGIAASIPFFFGFVGGVTGGWMSDFLTKRGLSPMSSCKLLVSSALFGITICAVGTVIARSNTVVLTLISISMFLTYVASSASWATVPVAAPSHSTASLGSIQNFGGYLGGALAPMLTGFIVEWTGGFSQALLLNAGITLTAGIAYLVLVREPIREKQVV
ncbi:MAG: MFS transporter [Chthonomonadales bacterium]